MINWTHPTATSSSSNDNNETLEAAQLYFSFPNNHNPISSDRTRRDYTTHHSVYWVLLFREIETTRDVILQELHTSTQSTETLTIHIPLQYSQGTSPSSPMIGASVRGKGGTFSKKSIIFVLVWMGCIAMEAYASMFLPLNKHSSAQVLTSPLNERSLYPPNVTRKFSPTLFSSPESSLSNRHDNDAASERPDSLLVGKKLFEDNLEDSYGKGRAESTIKRNSGLDRRNEVIYGHVTQRPKVSSIEIRNRGQSIFHEATRNDPLPTGSVVTPSESEERSSQDLVFERTIDNHLRDKSKSSNIKSPNVTSSFPSPDIRRKRSEEFASCSTPKKAKRMGKKNKADNEEKRCESKYEPNSVLTRLGFINTQRSDKKRKRVQPERTVKLSQKRSRYQDELSV